MLRVTEIRRTAIFSIIAIFVIAGPVAAQEALEAGPEIRRNVEFCSRNGQPLELDLYLPEPTNAAPRPVCLYIHGGGWQGGDKSEGEILLRNPVAAGWIGVSPNYRLSGEAHWPAQMDDINACLEWISTHARELNADPQRIIVAGGSAGGHLSLLAGLDQAQWGEYRIIGAFSLYGPTDLLAEEWNFHQIRYMIVNLLGADPLREPGIARAASPASYVDGNDVPVLMVHGDADSLVPHSQSASLLAILEAYEVPARLLVVPGGDHGNFDDTDPDWTEIAGEFLVWINQLAGHGQEPDIAEITGTSTAGS